MVCSVCVCVCKPLDVVVCKQKFPGKVEPAGTATVLGFLLESRHLAGVARDVHLANADTCVRT